MNLSAWNTPLFLFPQSLAYSRCSTNFVKANKLLADQLLPTGEKGVYGGGGERRFTKLVGNGEKGEKLPPYAN